MRFAVEDLRDQGTIQQEDTVVAVTTSSGLKDPGMTVDSYPDIPVIEPNVESLRDALHIHYVIGMGRC